MKLPPIRKDRATGKWVATRPRYGFGPTQETKTDLPSQLAAMDWVHRRPQRQAGTTACVVERSYPSDDGLAAIPAWTPLHYPLDLV